MEVCIQEIKNGFVVYDNTSLKSVYYKAVDDAIQAVRILLTESQEVKECILQSS